MVPALPLSHPPLKCPLQGREVGVSTATCCPCSFISNSLRLFLIQSCAGSTEMSRASAVTAPESPAGGRWILTLGFARAVTGGCWSWMEGSNPDWKSKVASWKK
jgi:hypothetical protein